MKTITVQATFEKKVDVSDFEPGEVNIERLAIDLTKREIETLSSEDFEYKIKAIQKVF